MAGRGRTPADSVLAALLAAGRTIRDAAREAGLSERTAFRRVADPAFLSQVSALRAEWLAQAGGALSATCSGAVATLGTLLGDDVDPRVRLGAAKAVIDLTIKVRQMVELEARIAALEAAQRGMGQ